MLNQPPPNLPPSLNPITTENERNLAMLSHLTAILGLIFGGGLGFLGPLIILMIHKEKSYFIAHHAKNSLNHQLTLLIACVILWLLIFLGSFVCIGILFVIPLIAIIILSVVLEIMACVSASKGEWTRLPFTIELVK
jgi:uncharacterized protein